MEYIVLTNDDGLYLQSIEMDQSSVFYEAPDIYTPFVNLAIKIPKQLAMVSEEWRSITAGLALAFGLKQEYVEIVTVPKTERAEEYGSLTLEEQVEGFKYLLGELDEEEKEDFGDVVEDLIKDLQTGKVELPKALDEESLFYFMLEYYHSKKG